MNSNFGKDETKIDSGEDLYAYFKDQSQTNPKTRAESCLSEADTMSK